MFVLPSLQDKVAIKQKRCGHKSVDLFINQGHFKRKWGAMTLNYAISWHRVHVCEWIQSGGVYYINVVITHLLAVITHRPTVSYPSLILICACPYFDQWWARYCCPAGKKVGWPKEEEGGEREGRTLWQVGRSRVSWRVKNRAILLERNDG